MDLPITGRRAVLSALLSTALVVTAGCGTAGPGAGRDGIIRVWALQDPQNEPVIRSGISDYNTVSSIEAELLTYVNDNYKQKLQISMGSPNAPDVFFNWGGGNLAQFVAAGEVVDLSEAMRTNPEVANAFLPSVVDVGKVNGRQYGLPMNGIQPVVLFHNKKVFTDAGLQPPETYDDLLRLIDEFKARDITPIALPGLQGWTELMYLEYLLDRIGGPDKFAVIAEGLPGGWRDPAMLEALRMCQDLAERGAFGNNFATINYDNTGASKIFATGKAAMFLMGSWEYGNQLSNNPDFVAAGHLGWSPFPSIANGVGDPRNVVGNPSNYFSVSAKSVYRAEAVDFLVRTLASKPYVTDLVEAGQVPAVRDVEDQLSSSQNADFAIFTYELVGEAPAFTQSWDQALTPSVGAELLTNLQKLFLSDITPEEFVSAMEKAK